jgi:hypothetical protein
MPVNLFGNINGTYQPPQMNLLGSAKVQNRNPVRYNETELGKNNPVVKVNISAEGLRALHGSKLPGSIDIKAEQERIKYASEHQPTESYYNRMSREMSNALEQKRAENNGNLTIEDREDALMSSFQSIADEIVKGYDSGTRVRFIEDPTSEDGYRRLTKEDELEILQKEFDDIAESKFSKRQQEAAEEIAKSLESLQKILEKRGKGSVREYHPIKIPDDFLEKLLLKSRKHIANL